MTGTQPILECRDLRKRFGERTAVDGVSFSISAGETYGLLGPNGAGKTTTISMICGLLRRDGGEVLVDGRPIDVSATDAKAAIGYVPQDLAIYPDLSARENLRFFGRLQRLSGKALEAAHRRGPRAHRPGRPRRRAHRQVLGWHEAPPQHRHRPAPPAETARPRRADGRGRPAEPERDPLQRRRPRVGGAWRSSTRPTTWRRPSGCATGSGSSTRAGSGPREPGASSSALVGGKDRVDARGRRERSAPAVAALRAARAGRGGDGGRRPARAARRRTHAASCPGSSRRAAEAGVDRPERGGRRAGPRGGLPAPDRQGAAGLRTIR